MNNIKNENYIVIQGFMVNELNLKGNELLIYAIIYGFSQLESQEFNGTLQYLASWCNSTKQGVIKALKSLIDKGLIEKKENKINNISFISYYATKFNSIKQSLTGDETKFNGGVKQSLMGGVKQSLINNIDINNINNINNNNIKENISKDKKEKHGNYGRVNLLNEEYERLINEFGKNYIDDIINRLDEYVEANNNKNKYNNYNLVIRRAIRDNWFKIKVKDKYEVENQSKDAMDGMEVL